MSDPTLPSDEHLAGLITDAGIGATPIVVAQTEGILSWALQVAAEESTSVECDTAIGHALWAAGVLASQLDALFAADLGV